MKTKTVKKRDFSGRKVSLTISAWVMGLLFFSPYLVMISTALKPKAEITAIPGTFLP